MQVRMCCIISSKLPFVSSHQLTHMKTFRYIDLGVDWSLCKNIKITTFSRFEHKYEFLLHFEELL